MGATGSLPIAAKGSGAGGKAVGRGRMAGKGKLGSKAKPLLPPGAMVVIVVPGGDPTSIQINDPNNAGEKITVAVPPNAKPGSKMAVPIPAAGEKIEDVVKKQRGWSPMQKVAAGAAIVGPLAVGGVILGEHLSDGAVSDWAPDGVSGAIAGATDWTEEAVGDATEWVGGAAEDVGEWTVGAGEDIGDWAAGAGEDAADWCEGAYEDVSDFVLNLF